MKIIYYAFFLFIGLSNIIASEYNLDAIIKAKGENTKQQDIDNVIVKESNKAYDSVSKEYYYKYTLPAQRAAQAREERMAKEKKLYSNTNTHSSSSNLSNKNISNRSSTKKRKKEPRGLKDIKNNGNIGGNPSFIATCKSGSTTVLKRVNGSWYTGFLGNMGHKFDAWPKHKVGKYICTH